MVQIDSTSNCLKISKKYIYLILNESKRLYLTVSKQEFMVGTINREAVKK